VATVVSGDFEWDGANLAKYGVTFDEAAVVPVTRPRKGAERVTLRTLREALGMTQSDMARALDTDQGEVSRIERRPDVLLSTLRKYAGALGARCEMAFVLPDGRRVLLAEPEAPARSPR